MDKFGQYNSSTDILIDKAFLQQAENDVKNLYNLYTNDRQETLKKVSIDEIATTVKSLKNGKSADERHISTEHLKYGGRKLLEYLTVLVNWIFENLQIPKTLKSGIACPILKKGKPAHDPNSYRKITITNLIGKVIEKIHLTRNSNAITEQQNKLQTGFTQGEMPIIAALILSELIAEAKSNKSPLYVAFMDARKAFDLVWHTGLFRDLYTFGITGFSSNTGTKTSHQKLDGNKIFQTQSTNYKEYDKAEYGHQQPIKYL